MLEKNMFKIMFMSVTVGILSLCFIGTSQANFSVKKVYKKTFPGTKPKCTMCHIDKVPKKVKGKHEHTEYGKKILKAKKELNKYKVDEEVFKKIGPYTEDKAIEEGVSKEVHKELDKVEKQK